MEVGGTAQVLSPRIFAALVLATPVAFVTILLAALTLAFGALQPRLLSLLGAL